MYFNYHLGMHSVFPRITQSLFLTLSHNCLVSQKSSADEPKLNQMFLKLGMFFLSCLSLPQNSFHSLVLLGSFIQPPGLPRFPKEESYLSGISGFPFLLQWLCASGLADLAIFHFFF